MKKMGFIMLPLVCAAGIAMADGVDREAETAQAPAVVEKAPASGTLSRNRVKSMPHGDLRHCLDLKMSEEIIRCSEKRRR